MKLLLSDYLTALRKRKPCEILWDDMVDYFDRGYFSQAQEDNLTDQLYNWCRNCHMVRLEGYPKEVWQRWMKTNINGLWCEGSNRGSLSSTAPCFYFEEENDAILFKLRWG